MKKIMFNDRYGLTKAVLEGRKTMTRRIIKAPKTMEGQWVSGFAICKRPGSDEVVEVMALDADEGMINNILPKYKPGKVVAVAQSYLAIHEEMMDGDYGDAIYDPFRWAIVDDKPGWSNKMFVSADLMPHQIRITNVRVERLQDISDEDCLREGIWKDNEGGRVIGFPFGVPFYYTFDGAVRDGKQLHWTTPKEAFSVLIDKVSGKGTWASNPWVFVYEFELVK